MNLAGWFKRFTSSPGVDFVAIDEAVDFGTGHTIAHDMDGGEWTAGPRRKMTRAEHDEVFGHNRKR